MALRFNDRVCVVTGATKGIGLAAARQLAAEGAQVVILDKDTDAFPEATAAISGAPPFCLAVDVTDDEACAAAVATIVDRFDRIDVLVNNAGIYAQGDVVHTDPALWDRILRVNLTGAFYMTRHVVPHMIRQGRGVIVNVASEAGRVGIPNQVAYNVSKAGLISFTQSLAVDLARYGIRANAVCPGTTWTPLVEKAVSSQPDPDAARRALEQARPLNRLGRVEEIAAAICFLASDEAAYATGAVLSVDGGYTAQ